MMLPVAIISFNRPDYLLPVLKSLAQQTLKLDRVALFQDGPRLPTDDNAIGKCIDAFARWFPHGNVFVSKANLGPALNIDRAEHWMFGECDAKAGLIFEDDLVVSPHYVATLMHILDATLSDPRVASVAAYGPIWPAPEAAPNTFVPMHLNWGFALIRQHWRRRQRYVDAYLDILRGQDYRHRDTTAIMQLRDAWGVPGPYTTQDVMRALATQLCGGIRLNTRAHLARYIGARGLHIDQKAFDAVGFDRWPVHPRLLKDFPPVDEGLVRWCRTLTDRFIGQGSAAA